MYYYNISLLKTTKQIFDVLTFQVVQQNYQFNQTILLIEKLVYFFHIQVPSVFLSSNLAELIFSTNSF